MTRPTSALIAASKVQLLPLLDESVGWKPNEKARATLVARKNDPNHPEGHLSQEEFDQKWKKRLNQEQEDHENLLRIARFLRQLLGADYGFGPNSFQICYGKTSGDGKRVTFVHKDPVWRDLLQQYGPSMRATDAFDPPPDKTLRLAVFALPIKTGKKGGGVVKGRMPMHMPIDVIEAVEQGWFSADIRNDGKTFMVQDREVYQRMHNRKFPNVAFFRNTNAGSDRSKAFVGRHPLSGKPVYAVYIPTQAVNKPGTKPADQIKIGVEVVERLEWYDTLNHLPVAADGGVAEHPETISDDEWAKREEDLLRNDYDTDLMLEKHPSWRDHHIRIDCFVFDARVLMGLPTDQPLTAEILAGATAVDDEGDLTMSADSHIDEVVTGQRVLVGRHCREVVEDSDEWLSETIKADGEDVTNRERLLSMAMAALETLVEKTEAKEKAKAEAEAAKKAKKAKKPPSRANRDKIVSASEDPGQESGGDETGDTTDDGDKGASEDDTSDDDASDPEGSDDTSEDPAEPDPALPGDVSSGEPAEAAADADA